jgi:hypothetical protein
MNNRVKCENCKWFDKNGSDLGGYGLCRVNPPDINGLWPDVNPKNDWCGSFIEYWEPGKVMTTKGEKDEKDCG